MGRAKLMTDLTFRLAADTAQLKKGLASARKQMGTFQKTTQKLGGMLAGAFAGQALISGIGRAIKSIAELEKVIKRTSLIAGGGEEAFADLAKQLGSSTVFTAQEAGEAMTFLAQAGFSVNQILDATPGVLDLAAAAQLDLAQAADITSNVLSGFGLAASEVNRVNDILVTTTNSANLNVEMLGESFKLVAPIAKSAGISINKAAGFIGVLGDAGLQGSMAGTQLKGVIAQLINPTAKGAAVMKRLGVEVTKTEEGGLDLSATLKDLKSAGLSTKDAFQLFGKIAATGALVMADATEKADELAIATGKVGVASDQAAKQLDTLSGDVDLLTSAWDGLIQKGSVLNGVFRFSVQAVTDLLNGYVGVNGQVRKALDFADKEIEKAKKSNEAKQKTIDIQNLVKGGLRQSGEALKNYLVAIENVNGGEEAALIIKEKLQNARTQEIQSLIEAEATQKASAEANADRTAWRMKLFTNLIQGNMARFDSFKAVDEEETEQIRGTLEERQAIYAEDEAKRIEALQAQKARVLAVSSAVQSAFASMSNNIISSFGEATNGFEGFIKGLAETAIKLIAMMLSTSLANSIAGATASGAATGPAAVFTTPAFIATAVAGVLGAFASIPKFANGGMTQGGLAMVGERGAEMVNLPSGSRVMSHPDTMKAIGGGGGSMVVIPDVRIKGEDIWLSFTEANRKLGNTRG